MKCSIDTSVLVRILANSPQPLAANVMDTVARRIDGGDTMVVSNLVAAEAYYAMQHHYGVPKGEVLGALRFLSSQPGFEFSDEAKAVLSIIGLERTNPGFVDRLIHAEGVRQGQMVLSCEKSFRRLPDTMILP